MARRYLLGEINAGFWRIDHGLCVFLLSHGCNGGASNP